MNTLYNLGLICSLMLVGAESVAQPFRTVAEARSVIENAKRSSDFEEILKAEARFDETVAAEESPDTSAAQKRRLSEVLSPSVKKLGNELKMVKDRLMKRASKDEESKGVISALSSELEALRARVVELESVAQAEMPMKLEGEVNFEAVSKVAEKVSETVKAIREAGAKLSKDQKEEINAAANLNIFNIEGMMRRR